MKNGFNMPLHGTPLRLLHSFGSKLMSLIKSNQNLKNLNDNKGKAILVIQHKHNRAAEEKC